MRYYATIEEVETDPETVQGVTYNPTQTDITVTIPVAGNPLGNTYGVETLSPTDVVENDTFEVYDGVSYPANFVIVLTGLQAGTTHRLRAYIDDGEEPTNP